jgi:hypothetical protein
VLPPRAPRSRSGLEWPQPGTVKEQGARTCRHGSSLWPSTVAAIGLPRKRFVQVQERVGERERGAPADSVNDPTADSARQPRYDPVVNVADGGDEAAGVYCAHLQRRHQGCCGGSRLERLSQRPCHAIQVCGRPRTIRDCSRQASSNNCHGGGSTAWIGVAYLPGRGRPAPRVSSSRSQRS